MGIYLGPEQVGHPYYSALVIFGCSDSASINKHKKQSRKTPETNLVSLHSYAHTLLYTQMNTNTDMHAYYTHANSNKFIQTKT